MSEIKICTIRFNLDNPSHKRAWEHLRGMDKKKYKSYTNATVDAINKYFDKNDNKACSIQTYENRIAEIVKEATMRGFAAALSSKIVSKMFNLPADDKPNADMTVKTDTENNDIDWDFLGTEKPDIKI